MKVLVSAFLPFNNKTNNYSMEVLSYINDVDKVVVDVVYDKCYEQVISKYNLDDYDLIIALGEARKRETLTLELNAYNLSNCSLVDNEAVLKTNSIIDNNKPEFLTTKIDYTKLEKLVEFSTDPGRFVCNNLYFHLLANYPNKSVFIHIPECNDDKNYYIKYANIINKIICKLEV